MATYYFAAETGSDANDGLSTGAPKQSNGAAAALILSGNVILWKCGERATLSAGTTGWSITGKVMTRECRMGVWNDDVSPFKPMWDGGTYLGAEDDVNWTHAGAG